MIQTEALKIADDLDSEFAQGRISNHTGRKAAQMLRALAQPEQEPVAWMSKDADIVYTSIQVDGCFQHDHIPLYTTPPQRKPLTNEEIKDQQEQPFEDWWERTGQYSFGGDDKAVSKTYAWKAWITAIKTKE